MNIIQLQDRLKGIPEEVLIGYVQTPTGEAPTYLVLSELERRKVMRDKYAGQQAEQPPVAEQIVSESMTEIMPQPPMAQGIATGMPPQGMPPAAPQEMMSESIEEVGIAANPTPNIGQNYNVGGVVGFAGPTGSYVPTGLTPAQQRLLKEREEEEAAKLQRARYIASGVSSFITEDVPEFLGNTFDFNNIGKRAIRQSTLANPRESDVFRGQSLNPDDVAVREYLAAQSPAVNSAVNSAIIPPSETLVDERAQELNNKFNPSSANNYSGSVEEALQSNYPKQQISQEPIDTNLYEPVDQDNLIAQQRQAYYDSIKAEQTGLEGVFGLQSRKDFYKEEREAIQAERDKYAGDKDSALNMALINAGLGIASGTSSNFLENVATGAMPGITSYTQDMKDMRAEDRLFDKEMRTIDRGERAEGRADMTAYKTNELALRKIAATSGLTQSEYATISKDATKAADEEFNTKYGDTGKADIFFANQIGETLTGTEKSDEILKRKTKALEELYNKNLLNFMNQRALDKNLGYSATLIKPS